MAHNTTTSGGGGGHLPSFVTVESHKLLNNLGTGVAVDVVVLSESPVPCV